MKFFITIFLPLCALAVVFSANYARAETGADYVGLGKNYISKNSISSKMLKGRQQRHVTAQNKQNTTASVEDERTVTPGKKTIKNKSKKARSRERARKRSREAKSQGMND